MFSLLFLHLFLYGCDIFMWRKTRINYSFIFELSSSKELKYRDVFLICTTAMSAVIGVLLVHLLLMAKGYSYTQVQSIPGLLLLVNFPSYSQTNISKTLEFSAEIILFMNIFLLQVFVAVLVCPFNVIYKSSRYRFLCVIRNIILSPLYKVQTLTTNQ